jgi:putative acetyltransferase
MDSREIVIRPVEERDNAVIAELIRVVFREFHIDRPGTVYFDPTTDNLYGLFAREGSAYFIAESEGAVIGGCGIYPTEGLPAGCAELVKFYLSASQRGRGTGLKLMEMSVNAATILGYSQLYIETLPELSRAITLYERAGFRQIDHPMGNSGHFGCNIWMLMDLTPLKVC